MNRYVVSLSVGLAVLFMAAYGFCQNGIWKNDPERPNIAATIWRTISDLTNLRYYFELTDMPNVVWVDLKDFDLSEGAPSLSFDLRTDLQASGNVSARFTPADPIEFAQEGELVDWKPAA